MWSKFLRVLLLTSKERIGKKREGNKEEREAEGKWKRGEGKTGEGRREREEGDGIGACTRWNFRKSALMTATKDANSVQSLYVWVQ